MRQAQVRQERRNSHLAHSPQPSQAQRDPAGLDPTLLRPGSFFPMKDTAEAFHTGQTALPKKAAKEKFKGVVCLLHMTALELLQHSRAYGLLK